MVLLESVSISPGTTMPSFQLKTPTNQTYTLQDCMGEKGLLIIFTCNHCPYAIAIWQRLIALSQHILTKGFQTVAINPNINPNYPDDSPENMQKKILEWNIPFPYLVDHTQEVATAYQAQCTPDIYVLTPDSSLYYHGRLDDNWQNEALVSKQDCLDAIHQLSLNQPAPEKQFPSMGCSIKWNT